MTYPTTLILLGLTIGTILYFMFGNNEQRNENSSYRPHSSFMNDQCTICMEKMLSQSQCTLRCGHTFHSTCIQTWRKTKQTCPLCRTTFP